MLGKRVAAPLLGKSIRGAYLKRGNALDYQIMRKNRLVLPRLLHFARCEQHELQVGPLARRRQRFNAHICGCALWSALAAAAIRPALRGHV